MCIIQHPFLDFTSWLYPRVFSDISGVPTCDLKWYQNITRPYEFDNFSHWLFKLNYLKCWENRIFAETFKCQQHTSKCQIDTLISFENKFNVSFNCVDILLFPYMKRRFTYGCVKYELNQFLFAYRHFLYRCVSCPKLKLIPIGNWTFGMKTLPYMLYICTCYKKTVVKWRRTLQTWIGYSNVTGFSNKHARVLEYCLIFLITFKR